MTGEVAGWEGRRAFGECSPDVAGVEDKDVFNVLLDGLLAASFATCAWSMLSDSAPGPPVWRSISKTNPRPQSGYVSAAIAVALEFVNLVPKTLDAS